MEAEHTPRAPLARLFVRVAGYFTSIADPAQSRAARIKALIKAGMASVAIALLLLFAYTLILIPFTPGIADIRKAKAETPSVLMSADGKELAVFKRLNREWVELDRISPHVIEALIATEDHRFHSHFGIDLKRTAASVLHTLRGDPQGGSTLTQQLARNLYPEEIGRKRTLTRKLKELITALKIEYAYSKDEILVTYLNTMPFLYNAFGIEMGARTYFDKPAAELSVLESATLVGMLKGTSYYNPVSRPERALARRNVVLAQMVKRGMLDQGRFEKLKKRPLRLDFARQPEPVGKAPHLAAQTRKWLIEWADRNDYNLYADGLVVVSTVDARLQEHAERAVARRLRMLQAVAEVEWGRASPSLVSTSASAYLDLRRQVRPFGYFWKTRGELLDAFARESAAYRRSVDAGTPSDEALAVLKADRAFMDKLAADKTRLETGFVAVDPTNGHVKAWVGSRDFAVDQFDHVAQARRQPGSTFKAFVFGAALEDGMKPDARLTDSEVEIDMGDGEVWRPTDMAGASGKPMTLRAALAQSKNGITAQVMQEVGPRKVAAFARRLGVSESPLEAVPALALGTSPVTLLEMVSAYGTIASGGERRAPMLVQRILDKDGNVIEAFENDAGRAVSAQVAHDLTGMLRAVIDEGTGRAIKARLGLRVDLAGKTGTTQNGTDGWFILMHPQLVAGAWVGFNDARVAMRSDHWGQGGHTALPLVGDFTQHALRSRLIDPRARFPEPPQSLFDRLWEKAAGLFEPGKPEEPERPVAVKRTAAPPPPPATEDALQTDETRRLEQLERVREQAETEAETEAVAEAGPEVTDVLPAGPAEPASESPSQPELPLPQADLHPPKPVEAGAVD